MVFCQPLPTNTIRRGDFIEMISSFHITASSASVPTPPGIMMAASPAEVARFTAKRDYNYAEIGRFTRCIERISGEAAGAP